MKMPHLKAISKTTICKTKRVCRHVARTKNTVLSKSELVKFLLIESVICIFTDTPVESIFSTVKSLNFN